MRASLSITGRSQLTRRLRHSHDTKFLNELRPTLLIVALPSLVKLAQKQTFQYCDGAWRRGKCRDLERTKEICPAGTSDSSSGSRVRAVMAFEEECIFGWRGWNSEEMEFGAGKEG